MHTNAANGQRFSYAGIFGRGGSLARTTAKLLMAALITFGVTTQAQAAVESVPLVSAATSVTPSFIEYRTFQAAYATIPPIGYFASSTAIGACQDLIDSDTAGRAAIGATWYWIITGIDGVNGCLGYASHTNGAPSALTYYYTIHTCPANSSGSPCACNAGYKPDPTITKCIPAVLYTIALHNLGGELAPNASRSAYAQVMDGATAKSGIAVTLKTTAPTEAGTAILSPAAGATGGDGKFNFIFTAPPVGGTHMVTATCDGGKCSNQDSGTITVTACLVEDLRKVEDIPPNEPDILELTKRLEKSKGADLALLPDAKTGAACIEAKYPGVLISSGTRTVAYQAHLKEIWDKSEELELPKNKNNAACKPLRDKVNAEKGCGGGHCIVFPPAEVSDHPTGKAFDVSRKTISGLLSTLRPVPPPNTPPLTEAQQHQADIKLIADWLASPVACNLVWGGSYGDLVHFEIP